MKSTGIIRKVDELGRVTIPKEIRDTNEIEERTPIEIFVDGNKIILEKFEKKCVFCNKKEELLEFKEQSICKKCKEKIIKLKA